MKKILMVIIGIVILAGIVIGLSAILKSGRPSIPLSTQNAQGVSLSSLLGTVKAYEAQGNILEAQKIYQKMINDFSGAKEVADWQKKAEAINIKLLFSPSVTANSDLYEIKPGDTLTKIAQEFKTTTDLIKRSNNISEAKIFPGKKIKVWTAPFSIVVDKSQNLLFLKVGEEVFKTYTIATGANNSTPVGTFKIINKITRPTWYKEGKVVPADSPENILGTRWLGLDVTGYGIHGTVDPKSLGLQVTQGCVRMSNDEVEELYTIVPVGTEVTVVD